MMRELRRSFGLVLAAAAAASAARAQPVLTEYVPTKPVLYIRWRGTDNAGAPYTDSRFKAFLDETELPTRFGTVFGQFLEAAGNDEETKALAGFVEQALPTAIKRPWVFYIAGLGFDDDNSPHPIIGFLIDPGDGPEGEAVEQWLVEQFGNTDDQEIRLLEHGDLLGVMWGHAAMKARINLLLYNEKDHALPISVTLRYPGRQTWPLFLNQSL